MMSFFDQVIATEVVPLHKFVGNRTVYLKREDTIHPTISGNKWRKLKYNILKSKQQNYEVLLTFGGAFSNHIAATALAGKLAGLKTIGFIRGEEQLPLNPTLKKATEDGMEIHYIDRTTYRHRDDYDFIDGLRTKHGRFLHIPEGGSNYLGINGCTEILDEHCAAYDIIAVPVGTGGTLSGLALSMSDAQQLIGFSALKGVDYQPYLANNLAAFISDEVELEGLLQRVSIHGDSSFGGYAKIDGTLMDFIVEFQDRYGILLDPIYTGKMMFSLKMMLEQKEIPNTKKILAIHTGGLQGIQGFQYRGELVGLKYSGSN